MMKMENRKEDEKKVQKKEERPIKKSKSVKS